MSAPALEVDGLSKRFGRLVAVDGVSLTLAAGDRVALIGPNGAGKSTFLDLVTGRISPDAGRILLAGIDVTALPTTRRVRLGLARTFQTRPLMPGLTVAEHLGLAILAREDGLGQMARRFDRDGAAGQEALSLLDPLGLAARLDHAVETLAYGEQRLVEVALALALRPRLLLLDEPSAGVSRAEASRLLAMLRALPASLAVLMIEHDMDMVFGFADRVAVLAEGRLIREGEPRLAAQDPLVRDIYLGRRHDRAGA